MSLKADTGINILPPDFLLSVCPPQAGGDPKEPGWHGRKNTEVQGMNYKQLGKHVLAIALPGVNIVSEIAGLSQTKGSLAIRPATVDTKAAQAETV